MLLVGKLKGKGPLGRPRLNSVDTETEWGVMDWIGLAQDRDKWRAFVMNLSGSIKCCEVLEWLHNWRYVEYGSAPLS
jgi:hypothetical protein